MIYSSAPGTKRFESVSSIPVSYTHLVNLQFLNLGCIYWCSELNSVAFECQCTRSYQTFHIIILLFSIQVKEEYKAQTIIGKWSADKTTYTLESNVFDDMYTVIPTDATPVSYTHLQITLL